MLCESTLCCDTFYMSRFLHAIRNINMALVYEPQGYLSYVIIAGVIFVKKQIDTKTVVESANI